MGLGLLSPSPSPLTTHRNSPSEPPPQKKKKQLCRLLKHALRTGKSKFAPLLDNLLGFLVGCYGETHVSSFVYAASIVVAEFGDARPAPRGLGAERAAQVGVGVGGWIGV